ncbi:DUF2577 domain-containing protein [Sporosarcina sp. FSL K6-1508]|uniref:DUF2577 domain-containing protein n=1 Tax=Sporosarcina sp. FSL K6-1508 TaxID=2921553 RepID=UPI0030F88CA3
MNDIVKSIKKSSEETTAAMDPVTICFGIVTKDEPLEILVEQRLPLKEDDLILTRAVLDHELDLTPGRLIGDEKYEFPEESRRRYKVHNKLEIDDQVTLLRMQGGQKYVVIDKEWIKDDTIKQQRRAYS